MRKDLVKKNIEKIVLNLGLKNTKYWRNILSTIPEHEIGVVKAGGEALEKGNLLQLAAEMGYLGRCFAKNDGFYLPLVLGGGKYYSKITSKAKRIKGQKIISEEMMKEILREANDDLEESAKALKGVGVKPVIISFDIVKVVPHGEEIDEKGVACDTGFAGDIVSIDTKPIIEAIYQNRIPLISHIGVYNNNFYDVDETDLAAEIVKTLKAKKLIILGDNPFIDKNGEIISEINSDLELKKMIQQERIKKNLVKKGLEAYELLNYLGPGNSVQITSLKYRKGKIESIGLIEELLGNGNGTKISAPFIITSYPLKIVEKKMLKKIINEVFLAQKKRLVKNYFHLISKKKPTVYIASKNAGGAISYPMNGFEYICKIFTQRDYEGLGVGTSTIDTVYLQKGPIAWRTSIKNKAAIAFYQKIIEHYKNQGVFAFFETTPEYNIYGVGLPEERKGEIIKEIAELPSTLNLIEI